MKVKIILLTIILISFFLFSSSIFIHKENLDYKFPIVKHFPKMPVSKSNRVTSSGVSLGRYLFYDPILSKDSSISCSSCHSQENAFGYNTDYRIPKIKLSVPFKRNVLPLFNLAWASSFFWDGKATTIENQVYFRIRHNKEMNSSWPMIEKKINRSPFYKLKFIEIYGDRKIDSISITKVIAQFERTLISYNSKFDRVMRGELNFTKDESDGYQIMRDTTRGNCFSCHSLPVNNNKFYSSFANNGINGKKLTEVTTDFGRGNVTKQRSDYGKFKIPTLRNLMFTAPYMHDGRFGDLDFVINFYSEGLKNSTNIDSRIKFVNKGGAHFTISEKKKIISFLSTLNDTVFIKNKEFSNPFKTVSE